MKKIAIVHFQPLELYPPVMNLLDYLSVVSTQYHQYRAYSTTNQTADIEKFVLKDIPIFRTKGIAKKDSTAKRLLKYFFFNGLTLMRLIWQRPSTVLYYETMSSWAPLFYKKNIHKHCKVLAHYHEYTTIDEYETGSGFGRLLWQFEKKNFYLLDVVSHTNVQRMIFFESDYPTVHFIKKLILPNYPPKSWQIYCEPKVKTEVLKLVHVGALGLSSMYLENICAWVLTQKGKVTLDIYSTNIAQEAKEYLNSVVGKEILLRGAVNYQDLPKILVQYHVGLILYKGQTPNHIYSAPNKLFEYLACRLDVWFPCELLGSYEYIEETLSPRVIKVKLSDFDSMNIAYSISKNKENKLSTINDFYCENIYLRLMNNF